MELNTLQDLLLEELRDLYSAENQILQALPKMIEKATAEELKEALSDHLEETKQHAERLKEIFKDRGETPEGKVCKGMQGILAEGSEVLGMTGAPSILDRAIIGACQRVEHYEMAAYDETISIAEEVGEDDIAEKLSETYDEEQSASERLTDIGHSAVVDEEFEEDMEDEESEDEDEDI